MSTSDGYGTATEEQVRMWVYTKYQERYPGSGQRPPRLPPTASFYWRPYYLSSFSARKCDARKSDPSVDAYLLAE